MREGRGLLLVAALARTNDQRKGQSTEKIHLLLNPYAPWPKLMSLKEIVRVALSPPLRHVLQVFHVIVGKNKIYLMSVL
jgi:hypothetical protein